MELPTPKELMRAGVHVGHTKDKWNPRMAPFVFGVRNNVHIIDVFETVRRLEGAVAFLREAREAGKTVLFVGAKVESRDIVKEAAERLGYPYMVGRWIGGLFTNFKVVKKRIEYFREIAEKVADAEEMEKYTKRERLSIERQLAKLQDELGGIKNLEKLPDVLFVSDAEGEKIAVDEARVAGIPIVALVDTNADPAAVNYPIPANNSALESLKLLYGAVAGELQKVRPGTSKKEETGSDKVNAAEALEPQKTIG